MRRLRRHLRQEDGSAATEFIGALPWMVLGALVAWQLLLFGAAATAAENAARTGSRAGSHSAATDALPGWLADGATVSGGGSRVVVRIEVPIIVPPFTIQELAVTRDAELP